ncbi:MAG: hypothetical protein JSW59_00165 [Phycisphaerales bacterium]|nr:MAG: hypothetical protein JSW59_00165 [Phycisphaerales bacterium]
MGKVSARSSNRPKGLLKHRRAALPEFQYEDGYRLSVKDLGKTGVKLELSHNYNIGGAIILPPEQVRECGRWLMETLEQESNGLPKQLTEILDRLSKQTGFRAKLERGDKKKIREALRTLKRQSARNKAVAEAEADEPALKTLAKKAV